MQVTSCLGFHVISSMNTSGGMKLSTKAQYHFRRCYRYRAPDNVLSSNPYK